MLINEIFQSINGESAYAGLLTVFVRTYGCNLRCEWCDTKYSWTGDEYTEMTVNEVFEKIKEFRCNRVTLTGGEPLIQQDAKELVELLLKKGYTVEIETNGAVDLTPYVQYHDLLITMDWKCPGSGERAKMIDNNLSILRATDVVKFVVADVDDLKDMEEISLMTRAQGYVSPVFGKIDPKDIVEYMTENKLNDVRLQIQMHKVIWPVDMRGV